MKKYIYFTIFFAVLSLISLKGQQQPIFSSDATDSRLYNPARMGEGGGFVGINYRSQWASDLDKRYAPVSYRLVTDLSGPLGVDKHRLGLGLGLAYDEAFVLKTFLPSLAVSYRLVNEDHLSLSAGIKAGLHQQRMDLTDIRISNPDDAPLLGEAASSQLGFEGGLGLDFRYEINSDNAFRLGLVLPRLFASDLNHDSGVSYRPGPHMLAAASYKLNTGAVSIEPLVLYRGMLGDKKKESAIEVGAMIGFLEGQLEIGGAYRANASTYNVRVHVRPIKSLQIVGIFEKSNSFSLRDNLRNRCGL